MVQGSGPKEQERERLARSLATSMRRSAAPESLRCLSEPWHALRVSWVGERIRPLVRKPDAANPHFRFDERDLETETWSIPQTPATERAGQQVMIAPTSTAPDLDSTRRPTPCLPDADRSPTTEAANQELSRSQRVSLHAMVSRPHRAKQALAVSHLSVRPSARLKASEL